MYSAEIFAQHSHKKLIYTIPQTLTALVLFVIGKNITLSDDPRLTARNHNFEVYTQQYVMDTKYFFLENLKNKPIRYVTLNTGTPYLLPILRIVTMFVCVEVLWPSQPNGVMLSAVSLPNHTFTEQV